MMQILKSREEWLKARAGSIGGSDAAAVVGLSPYMSNVELWEIKTGRKEKEDISENPAVKYGTNAEPYLRELFKLDYPELGVSYEENNLWTNDKYPFAHASLDGWLCDQNGRFGILEIKTTTIKNPAQKLKWDKKIPSNYYCQVLYYMAILEADFAILTAQLKWDKQDLADSEVFKITKNYRIEREEVQEDIDFLMDKAAEFWEMIRKDERPPLILPFDFKWFT